MKYCLYILNEIATLYIVKDKKKIVTTFQNIRTTWFSHIHKQYRHIIQQCVLKLKSNKTIYTLTLDDDDEKSSVPIKAMCHIYIFCAVYVDIVWYYYTFLFVWSFTNFLPFFPYLDLFRSHQIYTLFRLLTIFFCCDSFLFLWC